MIYIVIFNNGVDYDGYSEWNEYVTNDQEKAIKYAKESNYSKNYVIQIWDLKEHKQIENKDF